MIEGREHRWPIRVYFEDTDAGGIVYHASYLRFAERARTEALRELQVPHQELLDQLGLVFIVRRINVDYLSAAGLDEALSVVTSLAALGGSSLTLNQAVRAADGTARATLQVLLVCVRLSDRRPQRIPPRWRAALDRLNEAAPTGATRGETAWTPP